MKRYHIFYVHIDRQTYTKTYIEFIKPSIPAKMELVKEDTLIISSGNGP